LPRLILAAGGRNRYDAQKQPDWIATMFLVIDNTTRCHVFLENDPRDDGYEGDLQEGVTLETGAATTADEVDSTAQVPCLGRAKQDPSKFQVFSCTKDCRQAGYEPTGGVYGVFENWEEYAGE